MNKNNQNLVIIDDDQNLVSILVDFFQLHGFDVVGFNGIRTVEELVEAEPDLVMLDLVMPELSGAEIMELMSKSVVLRTVPVILISSLASRDYFPFAKVVMKKPFSLEELLEQVCQLLQ